MPKTVRDKRKASREMDRREAISFTKTMSGIDEAEKELLIMIRDKDNEPSNGRVGAIKALLDSKYKKLNKLLPDLKSVEMTSEDGSAFSFNAVVSFK